MIFLTYLLDDLLDLDATEWDYKMTALHAAAFFGQTDVVNLLLSTDFTFDKNKMVS
jgi:ankyrin repeat protein